FLTNTQPKKTIHLRSKHFPNTIPATHLLICEAKPHRSAAHRNLVQQILRPESTLARRLSLLLHMKNLQGVNIMFLLRPSLRNRADDILYPLRTIRFTSPQ
ncbi:hypothetical protein EJD97_021652, partial [Solanum chilense]